MKKLEKNSHEELKEIEDNFHHKTLFVKKFDDNPWNSTDWRKINRKDILILCTEDGAPYAQLGDCGWFKDGDEVQSKFFDITWASKNIRDVIAGEKVMFGKHHLWVGTVDRIEESKKFIEESDYEWSGEEETDYRLDKLHLKDCHSPGPPKLEEHPKENILLRKDCKAKSWFYANLVKDKDLLYIRTPEEVILFWKK